MCVFSSFTIWKSWLTSGLGHQVMLPEDMKLLLLGEFLACKYMCNTRPVISFLSQISYAHLILLPTWFSYITL